MVPLLDKSLFQQTRASSPGQNLITWFAAIFVLAAVLVTILYLSAASRGITYADPAPQAAAAAGSSVVDRAADRVFWLLCPILSTCPKEAEPTITQQQSAAPVRPRQPAGVGPSGSLGTTTVIQQTVQQTVQPIRERVIERVVQQPVPQPIAVPDSSEAIEARLRAFEQQIRSQLSQGSPAASYVSVASFAPSQRIDSLSNTNIHNPTITGGTISGASISGTINAATSTFAGLQLTGANCSSNGGGGKLTTDAFGFFVCADDANGSTMASGTTTQIQFNENGALAASASLTFDPAALRFTTPNASTTNLSADQASVGALALGSALAPQYGGTGSTTLSGILKGDGTAGVATARAGTDYELPLSFGSGITRTLNSVVLDTSIDWTGTFTGYSAPQLIAAGFSTTSADVWKASRNFFATTSADAWFATRSTDSLSEGGSNKYYSNDRVASLLQAGSGINLSYDHAGSLTISSFGGGGGGTDINWAYLSNGFIRPATSSNIVLVGMTSTSSSARLQVSGGATFDTATTTNLSVTAVSSSLLKTEASGRVAAATPGTDYVATTTGEWSGTLGGYSAPQLIAAGFSTSSVNYWKAQTDLFATSSANSWLAAKSTSNLLEGANLYYTDARADARLNATTSIGTLTAAPNLGTISTSLTGFLKATAGVLTTALVDLASNVTGMLPVANGGTGLSNIASGAVLIGNGTGALSTTTRGSLSETGSSILTITGGSNALLGTGATIQVAQASGSQAGFLSSADWTAFNSKQAALGFTPANNARLLSTTYPILGGGDLSANRTLSLAFGTTTANSWSQLQTFSAGVLSTTASGKTKAWEAHQVITGSTPGGSVDSSYNYHTVEDYGLAGLSLYDHAFAFNRTHAVSPGHTGNRATDAVIMSINGAPGAGADGSFYTASYRMVQAPGNLGGTAAAPRGYLFADNPYVLLYGTTEGGAGQPQYFAEASGGEVDIDARTGSHVDDLYGWKISQIQTHAVSGLYNDAALAFLNQPGAVGWDALIQIGDGDRGAAPPLKSSGTLLRVAEPMTIATGVDLSSATITGNAFKSNGFAVTGNGSVGVGTVNPAYKLDVRDGFFRTTYNTQIGPAADTEGGLVVGWNKSNGGAETNFYNVYPGAAASFSFLQNRGATNYDTLAMLNSNVPSGYTLLSLYSTSTTAGALIDMFGNTSTLLGRLGADSNSVQVNAVANVPLVFLQNNAERMRVAPNGKVGIGTTSPSTTLDVSGTGRFSSQLSLSGGVTGGTPAPQLSFSGYFDDTGNPSVSHIDLYGGAYGFGVSSGQLNYVSGGGHAFYEHTSLSSPRMVIQPTTGYVGIATATPGKLLDVNGDAKFGSSTGQFATDYNFSFHTGTDNNIGIRTHSSDVQLAAGNDANTLYKSFKIDGLPLVLNGVSNGNVGVGTSSPWRKFAVTGTVGFDGLTGSTGAGSLCLSANKQVVYNSGSDACLSSLRATKHDIVQLNFDALALVSRLEPVSFVYNDGDGRTRWGFIAEDAATVDPHLATYDASSTISGIDDRSMLALIVKAVQKLAAKIDGFADRFATEELTYRRASGDEIDAKHATTDTLCIRDTAGSTCITRAQLDALLNTIGQSPVPSPTPTDPHADPGLEEAADIGDFGDDAPSIVPGDKPAPTDEEPASLP